MRRLSLLLGALAFARIGALDAQTLPYDHMHLAAPDRAAALDWYVTHLDAKPHPSGAWLTFCME